MTRPSPPQKNNIAVLLSHLLLVDWGCILSCMAKWKKTTPSSPLYVLLLKNCADFISSESSEELTADLLRRCGWVVPLGQRPLPVAPGGLGLQEASERRGHAGPLQQLRLDDALQAAVQRYGQELEAVSPRRQHLGEWAALCFKCCSLSPAKSSVLEKMNFSHFTRSWEWLKVIFKPDGMKRCFSD